MLWLLLIWCLASVPFGVLVGRGIAAGHATLASADAASQRPWEVRSDSRTKVLV